MTVSAIRNIVTITAELIKNIGQCGFCNVISTMIEKITVNYHIITLLNSGKSRLSKQCRVTQITLFFFLQQGGSAVPVSFILGMLHFY